MKTKQVAQALVAAVGDIERARAQLRGAMRDARDAQEVYEEAQRVEAGLLQVLRGRRSHLADEVRAFIREEMTFLREERQDERHAVRVLRAKVARLTRRVKGD